jgi:hypothetical protein
VAASNTTQLGLVATASENRLTDHQANGAMDLLTSALEGHRKRLREALGNTLSDEFVDVILGKLVEALRPGLYDQLEEATLNAALATRCTRLPALPA